MVYYNPHITGHYNPLYNPTNQGPFFAWLNCFVSTGFSGVLIFLDVATATLWAERYRVLRFFGNVGLRGTAIAMSSSQLWGTPPHSHRLRKTACLKAEKAQKKAGTVVFFFGGGKVFFLGWGLEKKQIDDAWISVCIKIVAGYVLNSFMKNKL